MPPFPTSNLVMLPVLTALLCLLLGASCRERIPDASVEPTKPNATAVEPGVPVLDLSGIQPPPLTAAPAEAAREKPIACLLADGRVPFHRAQAQFLQHLDATDDHFAAYLHDARGDAAAQSAQLGKLAADPPSALLIQPLDLEAVAPLLADLRGKGVAVITLDSLTRPRPGDSAPQADLYCDPKEIGEAAAGIAIRALTRRAADRGEASPQGRVLEIRGSDNSSWCAQVHQGFTHALRGHPGIVLVHDAPADWEPEQAKARFADALRLQQHLDVVFAHDDFLALAVHQAARQNDAREDLLIIGVNGFPGPEGGLEMIRRNEIDASVQRPWLVDEAWQIVQKRDADPGFTPKANQPFPPRSIRPGDLDAQ